MKIIGAILIIVAVLMLARQWIARHPLFIPLPYWFFRFLQQRNFSLPFMKLEIIETGKEKPVQDAGQTTEVGNTIKGGNDETR